MSVVLADWLLPSKSRRRDSCSSFCSLGSGSLSPGVTERREQPEAHHLLACFVLNKFTEQGSLLCIQQSPSYNSDRLSCVRVG